MHRPCEVDDDVRIREHQRTLCGHVGERGRRRGSWSDPDGEINELVFGVVRDEGGKTRVRTPARRGPREELAGYVAEMRRARPLRRQELVDRTIEGARHVVLEPRAGAL